MRREAPLEEEDDWEPESAPRPATRPRASTLSLLALAGLVAFHVFQLAGWIRRDTRPPAWDQAIQLHQSLEIRNALKARDWRGVLRQSPKPGMPPFPPLYHLSILYAHSQPETQRAALWVNAFYMALLCLALWGLGRHLSDPWGGVAAAVLFTCTPEVQWLYLTQLLDLPLAAWVAAAYWALFVSEQFSRRGPALLFGACFAAAMLTKWSAFSYFLPAAWLTFRALRTPARRWKALAPWVLGAALIAPWYAVNGLVVIPKLFEASADNALPVWRGWAFLAYLGQMIAGLDTPFWLLGLLALAAPTAARKREDLDALVVWTASAYVFWTLVPNRQLRYLLPGLPPLAVLAATVWPRRLVAGLCVYQLLAAANYTFGRFPHVSGMAVVPVSFFRSDQPRAERWPIDEILTEAARLRQPGTPFSNVSLVANHPSFNGPNFDLALLQLGLGGLRMRGVTRRFCELAEFVVVKTGSLGPEGVIGQLPGAQEQALDPKGWFAKGYREAKRWLLPDGSAAVLFQRSRQLGAPVKAQRARFDYFEERHLKAEKLEVDLGPFDAARGVYPLARVRADRLRLHGLEARDVELELEGLSLVPVDAPSLAGRSPLHEVRFLRLERVRLRSAEVPEKALAAFLMDRVKGLSQAAVRFDRGAVAASAAWRGVRASAEASVELAPDGRALRLQARRASLLGLPLPVAALGGGARYDLPLGPTPDLPFVIEVPGLRLGDGKLTVGR